MAHWKTESALFQAEVDLMQLNDNDRHQIDVITRRIEGRTRLLKIMRRRWRKNGWVKVGYNPAWIMRRDLPR